MCTAVWRESLVVYNSIERERVVYMTPFLVTFYHSLKEVVNFLQEKGSVMALLALLP